MRSASFEFELPRDEPSGFHFDREGNPISIDRWAELHKDMEYVKVAYDDTACEGISISTVWTGFAVLPDSEKGLFETLVYVGADHFIVRHSTEDEARKVHADLVAAFRTVKVRGLGVDA